LAGRTPQKKREPQLDGELLFRNPNGRGGTTGFFKKEIQPSFEGRGGSLMLGEKKKWGPRLADHVK